MSDAVCVSEMKTLHVACDDLEGQHGKIMSILGEEDKHIINIMSISGCKNAMKDQKRSGSLGYLPWQRVAYIP